MVCVHIQLFLENLEHDDSFVYLSAIQGKDHSPFLSTTCSSY